MQLEIPPEIRKYLAPSTTAHLVAGTYGMRGADMVEIGKRQVAENNIIFRVANAPEGTRDHQLEIGTLNPSAMVPGNQVVLLLINMKPTNNFFDEFHRWRHGKIDGGDVAACCWVPDGAAGRYMVEQEHYYIARWFGEGPEITRQRAIMAGGVLVGLLCYALLSIVSFCILFLVLPWSLLLFVFIMLRWHRSMVEKGHLLGRKAAQNMLYDWCAEMMENGTFAAQLQTEMATTTARTVEEANSLFA